MAEQQTEETPQTPQAAPAKKGGSGLAPNIAGLLCYVLGLITGIIFLLIEKDNKFVKFHAIQSIIFSLTAYVVNFVLTTLLVRSLFTGGFSVISLLSTGFSILILVLWVMLMYKAYNNEEWELPLIGGIAKNMANK